MFVDAMHAFPDKEKPLLSDELSTNKYSNKQKTADHIKNLENLDKKASQSWVVEKSITFLKSQHQDMLLALQVEVEQLKRRNIDLQRALVLGQTHYPTLETNALCGLTESAVTSKDVEKLEKKISKLQEQLRLAQNTNKFLKKELETKWRHLSSKHHAVESTSPVICKAEQVRASQEGMHKLNTNSDFIFNVETASPKTFQEVNYSNRSNSICSIRRASDELPSDDEGSIQSECPTLPPITSDFQQMQLRPPELSPPTRSVSTRPPNSAGPSTRLGPIKHQPHHRPLPFNDPVSNSNIMGGTYPIGGFREVSGITHSGLPVSRSMGISRPDTTRRKMISSHGFPTPTSFDSPRRMDQRHLPRTTDEMVLRSATERMEIRNISTGFPYNSHSYNRQVPTSITLPALRQSLDTNQASRRRRNLEQQKKRLTQSRHPF